ncbi:hypothetical protein AZE42_08031 [Rhizopogon vesiculosus]|uniref:Uncharacterized protein n=1 Tax=Rhizopogon vesiculosus TaxID=180088 RepID=A0A1J8PRN3_9AGAM|nr:hypothetical protein AZE42_08031 [Rhizopogon vesiculosus]
MISSDKFVGSDFRVTFCLSNHIMTTSYKIYVFLESRDQGSLPVDHSFYQLVHNALKDVIQYPLVISYMAKTTLANELCHDKVAEKQRADDIIRYLQDNCPIVSGSDSPAMDSSLVETRTYFGCGKDSQSRKTGRQHIYIQKCLVDAWLNTHSKATDATEGRHLLITIFMKLCLLRGFVTAVKLAFASDNMKDQAQGPPPGLAHGPPCSFERFLYDWDCCVSFLGPLHDKKPRYDQSLCTIALCNRHALCHTRITDDMKSLDNKAALIGLATGHFTKFPPVEQIVFPVIHPACMQVWDSLPTEGQDHKPGRIELTAWSNRKEEGTVDMSIFCPRRWITVCR